MSAQCVGASYPSSEEGSDLGVRNCVYKEFILAFLGSEVEVDFEIIFICAKVGAVYSDCRLLNRGGFCR